jgi:AGCS family alanine or glycine:cation symporter
VFFEKLNGVLWGYGTIFLILGTGVFFTIKLRFLQFRSPLYILKKTILSKENPDKTGGVSRFQALSTALAASMGTGNIVGVAAAIAVGGPGAVFWMWVSALFGMATAYSENYLGVLYKNKAKKNKKTAGKNLISDSEKSAVSQSNSDKGENTAGAMLYLEKGLNAKPLAIFYAAAAVAASLGIGNMTQSAAISDTLSSFGIVPLISGVITAILAALVVFGGARRVAKTAEKIIPAISLFYIIGAVIVIVIFWKNIPAAIIDIFTSAFGMKAAAGGFSGVIIKKAVTIGLQRGIFSNEAGMGSSVLVHTETDCADPETMGLWAVLEVFIDTIICCTVTALVILLTKTPIEGTTTAAVTAAFSAGLGSFAEIFISASIIAFAFATVLGWSFYGEKCVQYLSSKKSSLTVYRTIYIASIIVGAVVSTGLVWEISDTLNALMLLPNLIGILGLSGEVGGRG